MELNIIEKKEIPLLSRTEIKAGITFDKAATPSKEQLKQQLASTLSADQKLIVIKRVNTNFGSTKATVDVYLYSDEKTLKDIEPKEKKKKGAKPKEEKPAEKKEEKKEEKSVEKKEEPPKEEKPAEKPKEEEKK